MNYIPINGKDHSPKRKYVFLWWSHYNVAASGGLTDELSEIG